eukprot:m.258546 g.258546  ORF g.258546 m.258546 type:complete len:135 (-) comp31267_c0_seq1:219-623(-)
MPSHRLGWTYNPVPQSKVEWVIRRLAPGITTRMPVPYTRKEKWVALLQHPNIPDTVRGAIKGALAAATAAGVGAAGGIGVITANPAVTWPAFYAAFKASLLSLTAAEVGAAVVVAFVDGCKFHIDSEHEEWSRV